MSTKRKGILHALLLQAVFLVLDIALGSPRGPLSHAHSRHATASAGCRARTRYHEPSRHRLFNLSELLVADGGSDGQGAGKQPRAPGSASASPLICAHWIVVATAAEEVTPSLEALLKLPGWCKVVVLHRKEQAAADFQSSLKEVPDVVVLNWQAQEALPWRLARRKLLPEDHAARKSIGYLYAFHHGAELLYDTDEYNAVDVRPNGDALLPTSLDGGPAAAAAEPAYLVPADGIQSVYNPFSFWLPEDYGAWPRGFPLTQVADLNTRMGAAPVAAAAAPAGAPAAGSSHRTCVLQSLANGDPDVDAIYRLTRPLPLYLRKRAARLSYPAGVYAPSNAQATLLNARELVAGLLLPTTVDDRVADVWRSYILQRAMWGSGCRLAFADPWVTAYRGAPRGGHLADFADEMDLYLRTEELISVLNRMTFNSTADFACRVMAIYISLYEHGLIEESDVRLVHVYLLDLGRADCVRTAAEITMAARQQHHVPPPAQPLPAVAPPPPAAPAAAASTGGGSGKRCAVCITGLFRGGPFTLPSIRSSVLGALGMPFDVLVVAPEEPPSSSTVARRDVLYLVPNVHVIVRPSYNLTDSLAAQPGWAKTSFVRGGTYHTAAKWIRQLTDIGGCAAAIGRAGRNYTHALRVRADTLVPEPLPLPPAAVPDGFLVVPAADGFNGVNDRFAYGGLSAMMSYFSLLDALPGLLRGLPTACRRGRAGHVRSWGSWLTGWSRCDWGAETMLAHHGEMVGLAWDRRGVELCRVRDYRAGEVVMERWDVDHFPPCAAAADELQAVAMTPEGY